MALCVHDGFWHPQAPLYRVSDILFETANEVGSQLKAYESDVRFAEDGEEVLLADYVSEQFAALVSASEQYMSMIDSISSQSCAYLLYTKDIRREIGVIRPSSKKQCLYATLIDMHSLPCRRCRTAPQRAIHCGCSRTRSWIVSVCLPSPPSCVLARRN